MNIIYRNALSALMLVAASGAGFAQSINLLGVFNDGTHGQIKAEIELEDKEIQSVVTYSYRMCDGYNTTASDYELIDGRYLTADIQFNPGYYAYRIKVDFTDGSTLLSECIDKDYTEAFMWLGDYPFQTAVSGWSGHNPQLDISIDNPNNPTVYMTVNDTIFYKGVSNHAQGHVSFLFDRPFTRFVTRYGIQDDKVAGNLTYAFWNDRTWTGTGWSGGSAAVRQKMYSKTNPARGENPCIRDLDLDMTGKNSLYIEALSDGNVGGDHAHLLLSRLYTDLPDNSSKSAQTVRFITPGGALPVPVHVLGEELCACGVIPDLSRKISVIRSRNISMSCVFQNLAGLQNRYPYNQWQEILGNCDITLFLGCTDALTAQFISDRTGEASIAVTSKAKQLGTWRISNYTPEYRETSGVGKRKLMTMDEVLRMDVDRALVILRGRNVLEVDKYDYSKHPEAKKLHPSKAASHIPAWQTAPKSEPKEVKPAPPKARPTRSKPKSLFNIF